MPHIHRILQTAKISTYRETPKFYYYFIIKYIITYNRHKTQKINFNKIKRYNNQTFVKLYFFRTFARFYIHNRRFEPDNRHRKQQYQIFPFSRREYYF